MAIPNAASDLATRFAALSPYTVAGANMTLTVDTNVFVGPVLATQPGVPDFSVFVQNQGGVRPDPYINNSADFFRFQVLATVRSTPGDYSGGEDLARGLIDIVHRSPPSGYATVLSQQSGPNYLGEDDHRRHTWQILFELWWKGA